MTATITLPTEVISAKMAAEIVGAVAKLRGEKLTDGHIKCAEGLTRVAEGAHDGPLVTIPLDVMTRTRARAMLTAFEAIEPAKVHYHLAKAGPRLREYLGPTK